MQNKIKERMVLWQYYHYHLNPLPDDKILDQTKLSAFADDKLIVTKMIISGFCKVENIVRKEEIACTSNFSFFPQCCLKASFLDASKGVIVWEWVKECQMIIMAIKLQISTFTHVCIMHATF